MTYRVALPKGADPVAVLPKLRQLEEEDPQLHLVMAGGTDSRPAHGPGAAGGVPQSGGPAVRIGHHPGRPADLL